MPGAGPASDSPSTLRLMPPHRLLQSLLVGAALAVLPAAASAQAFTVVAHSSASDELNKAQLADIMLKKTAKFPNGAPAQPVDLTKTSPIRAAFSQAILGKAVGAVESYWQTQLFGGTIVPPAQKNSDADIIEYVKTTPGGIGYVAAGAAVPSGVKTITVK